MVQTSYWTSTYGSIRSCINSNSWSYKVPKEISKENSSHHHHYSAEGKFDENHHYVGIVTVCLTVLQPVLGWYADKVYDNDRKQISIWPDKIHWWFGHCIMILSFAAIVLGIYF